MRNLIFSMSVSADGFIADARGEIDWSPPDDELHRFHNERVQKLGGQLLGRRLYETMAFWETPEAHTAESDITREFAHIWSELPKVVFSSTLERVEGTNMRLARDGLAEEVGRLKQEASGDLGVGGAGLAAACTRLGLVDEYELFVNPVVLGGGTPYFPALEERIPLELVETRTFASRVVYLRYRRA